MLRYVLLRHEGVAKPHFDLMLETAPDSLLATWRVYRWPIDEQVPLEKLAEHRRDYLEYEGPLSNDRGHVKRIVAGTHRIDRKFETLWDVTLLTPVPEQRIILATVLPDQWVAVPLSS